MTIINRISFVLAFLAVLISVYIFFSARKMESESRQNLVEKQIGPANSDKLPVKSLNQQKNDYRENIKDFSSQYKILLAGLDKEVLNTEKDSGFLETLGRLRSDLSDFVVPGPYKNMHLQFSRSALLLDSFLETKRSEDKQESYELFLAAVDELNNIK